MEDYIPTEQDIADFNKFFEERKSYTAPKILLVEFSNKESKEMSYKDIRYMFMLMWYKYQRDNTEASKTDVRNYFENTITNFKELYTVLLEISDKDYEDIFADKPYPYIVSLWNQLFDKHKVEDIINTQKRLDEYKARLNELKITSFNLNLSKFLYRIKKYYPYGLSIMELYHEANDFGINIWKTICTLANVKELKNIKSRRDFVPTREMVTKLMSTIDINITDHYDN